MCRKRKSVFLQVTQIVLLCAYEVIRFKCSSLYYNGCKRGHQYKHFINLYFKTIIPWTSIPLQVWEAEVLCLTCDTHCSRNAVYVQQHTLWHKCWWTQLIYQGWEAVKQVVACCMLRAKGTFLLHQNHQFVSVCSFAHYIACFSYII